MPIELLQIKEIYILNNATICNKISKFKFITNILVIRIDDNNLVYDLLNENLRINKNYDIKIDPKKTKYKVLLENKK